MNSEIRSCQNCKKDFRIEPEDFVFYEKMKVPPPTWCPECRLQRRLSFLNLTSLFHRDCNLCGKKFISQFAPTTPHTIYCPQCWWSDAWNPADFAREYDFSRPFFEQYRELLETVPLLGNPIDLDGAVLNPYNSWAGRLKDCFFLFQADENENCAYGVYVFHSSDLYDTSLVQKSEACFDSMHVYKVYGGVGLEAQVFESVDVGFLRDSSFSKSCFASANLKNKKYVFFNEQLTEEEYREKLAKIDLGSFRAYQKFKSKVRDHWNTLPKKTKYDEYSVDSTGNYVHESRNCKDCYEVSNGEDSKYLMMVRGARDSYDITTWGDIERCYEGLVGVKAADIKFGLLCAEGAYDSEYSSWLTRGAAHNFGCVSTTGQYMILNKQYSKEEYAALRERIIEHMKVMPYQDSVGRIYSYGEFFPPELSPWAYNETLAQYMFPLDSQSAERGGYVWREKKREKHAITVVSEDLPDHVQDTARSILKEVIECSNCGSGFRVIEAEFDFLKMRNFPLPRICPVCRIAERVNLWMKELRSVDAACSRCHKGIKVPSSLAGIPNIYCKDCYQAEVV